MANDDAAPFDRMLLDRRRRRWLDRAEPGRSFLLDAVATELAERLSIVQRRFEIGVDLAGHTGALADRLAASGQIETLIRIERDAALFGAGPGLAVVADEEVLPLADESVDLVASALSLHLTNDTPGVFAQVRRALKPDGLFFAALLGGDTLNELRVALLTAEAELAGGAAPRIIPFSSLRDTGALLQRTGFALPVIDLDRITVRYATMFDLLADVRGMGMANMLRERSRRPLTRSILVRAAQVYAERFADADGRVRATFEIIYLSGWKPHESQQKPLRPGSAAVSLKDVLKS